MTMSGDVGDSYIGQRHSAFRSCRPQWIYPHPTPLLPSPCPSVTEMVFMHVVSAGSWWRGVEANNTIRPARLMANLHLESTMGAGGGVEVWYGGTACGGANMMPTFKILFGWDGVDLLCLFIPPGVFSRVGADNAMYLRWDYFNYFFQPP